MFCPACSTTSRTCVRTIWHALSWNLARFSDCQPPTKDPRNNRQELPLDFLGFLFLKLLEVHSFVLALLLDGGRGGRENLDDGAAHGGGVREAWPASGRERCPCQRFLPGLSSSWPACPRRQSPSQKKTYKAGANSRLDLGCFFFRGLRFFFFGVLPVQSWLLTISGATEAKPLTFGLHSPWL